jgi:hypothetical protein
LREHLDLSGGFVESGVPPVVGELFGRVVAHAGGVELQVRADGFGYALVRLAKA